jgi:pyruvate,orthophosphate dikinase
MANVYFFGEGHADGRADMKDVLGGKGANLAEMTNLGIPVPPGFTISSKLCIRYIAERRFPDDLRDEVRAAVQRLERIGGKQFGGEPPLLVSVRSGAKVSMPGMMDTILNLGLNDRTVQSLAQESGSPRFAYDSYRRLVQMYGEVVCGIKGQPGRPDPLAAALDEMKQRRKARRDIDLSAEDLQQLVGTFKAIVQRETGSPFPDDAWEQLWGAIEAVFKSWQTKRAVDYRRVHRIPEDLGTAVNVMMMVYGNRGEDSATGVAFTRNPSTGVPGLFGEFLINAQGEDVVAGTRDPEPIAGMRGPLPQGYAALEQACAALEHHYRDMQDVEFTVERGKLYMLQTRTGKRTAQAAVRAAVDMVREGLIDRKEAVRRVEPGQINQLLHPTLDPEAKPDVLTTGLPASPGAAVGRVVFDADKAAAEGAGGKPVILVRHETSADDFHGMVAAQAILTARGGMTSHAAVVARGMGKCCVAGAKDLEIDEAAQLFRVDGRPVRAGDWLTLDGSTGRIMWGKMPLVEPELSDEFATLMSWADEVRCLRVRANADTPMDARRARAFGAEGIGLCRTEHMFFEGDRIQAMREMIVARGHEGRQKALAKIEPMQREDFIGIFREMAGLPVTIRLLDPPLHEFLPKSDEEVRPLARTLGIPVEQLRHAVETLAETNPMLGHRGCRLGITYPEITEMQARAIFEAACQVAAHGVEVHPEVMVPLVAHVEELKRQADLVRQTAEKVFEETGQRIEYLVGTMIELPRAALTADEIAREAEFFSFGTNDLTQTTFGLSRDDAGRFLPFYVEQGILPDDPFQSLDYRGVGKLVEMGVRLGREVKPALKVGICGEHGGDPASITFCHRAQLNYVSCSPFRVPVARLAAAQAAIGELSERDV